jgi:hypothetical protein
MFILLTVFALVIIALFLVIIASSRTQFRYTWLIAVGGAFLAWINVLFWRFQLPVRLELPSWEPANLFVESLSFTVDSLTWPFAFSLASLILAVILTAAVRENFPAPLPWAASFVLGGMGLLAVLADNPLSLIMVWAAIDLAEMVTHIQQQESNESGERITIVFTMRLAAIGMLFWARMVSISTGTPLIFQEVAPQTSFYLLIAAGLRLGVLPLHLPYSAEITIRRGYGSMLRLVSAASSLIILARIPKLGSPVVTSIILILTAIAAVYAGWMWVRSPDELSGRPYWMIGLASLAIAATLNGNPTGAIGWGCALILAGGALFLTSIYQKWINRLLWIGLVGLSALPFTLSAVGWETGAPIFIPVWPLLVFCQACLLAGFYRHAMRPALRSDIKLFDRVSTAAYVFGIGVLLGSILLLGVWGWEGALRFGNLIPAVIGNLLALVLFWSVNRFQFISSISARWISSANISVSNWLFRLLAWGIQQLGRISDVISATLEGEGGIMWTLLILVVIISLLSQGTPIP